MTNARLAKFIPVFFFKFLLRTVVLNRHNLTCHSSSLTKIRCGYENQDHIKKCLWDASSMKKKKIEPTSKLYKVLIKCGCYARFNSLYIIIFLEPRWILYMLHFVNNQSDNRFKTRRWIMYKNWHRIPIRGKQPTRAWSNGCLNWHTNLVTSCSFGWLRMY